MNRISEDDREALVSGGQGRTEREIVEGAALMIAMLILVAIAAVVMAIVCE